jgi:hypothetical protein
MAFRTLGIVIVVITRWGVAFVTLVVPCVIEVNIRPGRGVVALNALAAIVVGGCVAGMT